MGLNLRALIFHRNNKKEGRRSAYRQTSFRVSQSHSRVSQSTHLYGWVIFAKKHDIIISQYVVLTQCHCGFELRGNAISFYPSPTGLWWGEWFDIYQSHQKQVHWRARHLWFYQLRFWPQCAARSTQVGSYKWFYVFMIKSVYLWKSEYVHPAQTEDFLMRIFHSDILV